MFYFRFLLFILLSLCSLISLSADVYFNTNDTSKKSNILLPGSNNTWSFGLKLLYLQPSFSDIIGDRTYSLGNGSLASVGQGSVWSWGGMIEGMYYFNMVNDMNINWSHINSSHTSIRGGEGLFLATQLGLPNLLGNVTINDSFLYSSPTWDAFNLEFGQLINSGDNRNIRVHTGINYSRIDLNYKINLNILNTPIDGGTEFLLDRMYSSRISYNGLGPRLGVDFAYAWDDGLGIYANGALAILMGSGKYSNFDNINLVTVSGTNTIVVPSIEAKLGFKYSFNLAGTLTVNTGWMWMNYFNTLSVVNSSIVGSPRSSDFGLAGPYIGFKWSGLPISSSSIS